MNARLEVKPADPIPETPPLGVLNARDGLRALLAAGNHDEVLLRNDVMRSGDR